MKIAYSSDAKAATGLKLFQKQHQALNILSQSNLELQATVNNELAENFALEIDDDFDEDVTDAERLEHESAIESYVENEQDNDAPNATDTITEAADSQTKRENDKTSNSIEDADLNALDKLDANWEDIYIHDSSSSGKNNEREGQAHEEMATSKTSLMDHLQEQLDQHLTMGEDQKTLALFIFDELDEDGFLQATTEQLQEDLENIGLEASRREIDEVVTLCQQFDPLGIASRGLAESLCNQIRYGEHLLDAQMEQIALDILENDFTWLTEKKTSKIKKKYQLTDDILKPLYKALSFLKPRPAMQFADVEENYIEPDLLLKKNVLGKWSLILNNHSYIPPRISAPILDMEQQKFKGMTPEDAKAIKEKLKKGREFIWSLEERGKTVMKVGNYLLKRQSAFFSQGEIAMQPLVLKEVADELELHESTISRAIANKYIQTPLGTFELKYFFPSGLEQSGKNSLSSTAIKAHIKKLIDQEPHSKPLSDIALVKLLKEKHELDIARRTVAKYREQLKIPSSSSRKH